MNESYIPITSIGRGSQPVDEDGAQLAFVKMPSEMMTYAAPVLPEPEQIDGLEQGIGILQQIHQALLNYRAGDNAVVIELNTVDDRNRRFLNEAFGDGEVSVVYNGTVNIRVQESVLAGVWRVHYLDADGRIERDTIEISDVPAIVRNATFAEAKSELHFDDQALPPGLMNAVSLITEINEHSARCRPGKKEYVINLSLLPHTPEDLAFLGEVMGSGPVTILSRGYGNCRITSTATRNVWWVQYFNSQDTIILNTIEISYVPKVACAAQEDIDDSAERIGEILEIYR